MVYGFYRAQRAINRLHFHDHARPATVRFVFRRVVLVDRVVANVVGLNGNEFLYLRTLQHGLVEVGVQDVWKDGENVEAHK